MGTIVHLQLNVVKFPVLKFRVKLNVGKITFTYPEQFYLLPVCLGNIRTEDDICIQLDREPLLILYIIIFLLDPDPEYSFCL